MSESYFLDPAQQWFLSMSNAKAERDQRIFERIASDPALRNSLVDYSSAHVTGSAELGLALAQGGIPAGDPMAAMAVNDELSFRSNLGPIEHQGGGWWDDATGVFDEWVTNPIQGTVRWGFSAWDAAYQMVAGGAPIRARQLAQTTPGMDFSEAWAEQDPFFFEALGGLVAGERVNIGSGWFPNSDVTDEVSLSVNQQMAKLEQETIDLPTNEGYRTRLEAAPGIWEQAVLEGGQAQAELGKPIVQQNMAETESVMFEINPMGDVDKSWYTPWSPGRIVASNVYEPGTEAFSRLSGFGDFAAQIFADPVDYLGMAWAKAGRNSRKVWGEAQGLAKEVTTKVDDIKYASEAEEAGRVLGVSQGPVAELPVGGVSQETARLASSEQVAIGPQPAVAPDMSPRWFSGTNEGYIPSSFDPPKWYMDTVNNVRQAARERWRGGVDTSRKATRVMPGSYKVELPRVPSGARRYAKIQRKGKGRNKYWDITMPDGTRLSRPTADPRFDLPDTKYRTLGEAEARLESHLVGDEFNDAQKVHGMTVEEFGNTAETFSLDNPFSVINATNPATKQAKGRGVIHRVRHKKSKTAKGQLDNAQVTVFGKTMDISAGVTDNLPEGLVAALGRDRKLAGNNIKGFTSPNWEKWKNTSDWLEANGYGKLKWDEDTTLIVDSYIGGTGVSPEATSRMSFKAGDEPMFRYGGDVSSATPGEVNEILDFMATGGKGTPERFPGAKEATARADARTADANKLREERKVLQSRFRDAKAAGQPTDEIAAMLDDNMKQLRYAQDEGAKATQELTRIMSNPVLDEVAEELPTVGDAARMTDPDSVIAAREAGRGIPMGAGDTPQAAVKRRVMDELNAEAEIRHAAAEGEMDEAVVVMQEAEDILTDVGETLKPLYEKQRVVQKKYMDELKRQKEKPKEAPKGPRLPGEPPPLASWMDDAPTAKSKARQLHDEFKAIEQEIKELNWTRQRARKKVSESRKVIDRAREKMGLDEYKMNGGDGYIEYPDRVDAAMRDEGLIPDYRTVERGDDTVVDNSGSPMAKWEYEAALENADEMITHFKEEIAAGNDIESNTERMNDYLNHKAELDEAWNTGRPVSGTGAEAIPVKPDGEKAVNPIAITNAEWNKMANDEWVEVYHATDVDTATKMMEEGVHGKGKATAGQTGDEIVRRGEVGKTGEGMYVGGNAGDLIAMYANESMGSVGRGVVMRIYVRKGDMLMPREAGTGRMRGYGGLENVDKGREAFGHSNVGAVVYGDVPAENISFVNRSGGQPNPVVGGREIERGFDIPSMGREVPKPVGGVPEGLGRTADTPTTYKAETAKKIEASATPEKASTYRGVRNDIDPTFQLHGKKADMFLDKLVAVSRLAGGKKSIALLDDLLSFFPKSGVTVPVSVRTALYEASSKSEMRDIFVKWLVTEGGQEAILPGGTQYGRLSNLTGGARTEESRLPSFLTDDRRGFSRRFANSLPTNNVNFVDDPTSSYELVLDALPQYNLVRGGEVPRFDPDTGKKLEGVIKVEDVLTQIRNMTPRDKAGAYEIMADLNQMLFSSLRDSGVSAEMAYGVSRWWKGNLAMSNFSSARFGKVQLQAGSTDLVVLNGELVPGLGPVLDADLWTGALSMPHPKELKRVANQSDMLGKIANTIAAKKVVTREGTEQLVGGMKFEDRVGLQVMTFAMNKLWKPFVLLRGAWTLRILMDDQMRMMADGYSTLNHPARILNYAMTRPKDWKDAFMKGRVDVNGISMTTGNINEMAHGQIFRDAMMRMYDEQVGMGAYGHRQFIDVQRADPRYAEGLAFEVTHLAGSPLTKMLASSKGDPVEKTVRWLMGKGRKGSPDPARELASLAHLNRVDPAVAERILALDEQTLRNVVSKQWAVLHHRLGGDVVLDTGQGKLINMDTLRLEEEGIEVSNVAQWLVRQDGDPELLRIVAGDKTIVGDISAMGGVAGDVAGDAAIRKLEELLKGKVKTSERYPVTVRGPRDIAESGAQKNLEQTLDDTVGHFMELMMTMPSNRLSRSVEFRNAYWERMVGFYPYMDDALRKKVGGMIPNNKKAQFKEALTRDPKLKGQITDLDQVDAQAKAYALTRVEQTLFTLQSKKNISDSLNLVFPFVEAWGEFLTRWGRIMVTGDSNIHVARRFQQTVEGARGSGFFYENEYGQEVFNYPAFTTKFGVELHNKLNNLPVVSGFLGGDVSGEVASNIQSTGSVESLNFASGVIPGFGPVFQMASKQILPDDPKFDWVRDIVTPFGSSGGVAYQFSPAWFKRFLSANGTLDDPALEYTYNSTLMDVIRTKIDNGDFSGVTSQQDVNALITAAEEEAKGVLMVRSAATFFEPASPAYKFQKEDKDGLVWSYTNLGEAFYKLQEEAGGDASVAFTEFYERFGFLPQAFRGGKTYSVLDRSLTEEGYKFERGNSDLFNKYPATAMYLDPSIAGESEYDHSAMLEQLNRGLREQWTGEQFVFKQQDQLGDLWYDNANKIAASMSREQGQAYLASTSAVIQENYPAWNQPIPGQVRAATSEQQMFEVDLMLSDSSLAGSGALEGARMYNAMRESVLAEIRSTGASTIDGPQSTTTVSGRLATDSRQWLREQADELILQYPAFGPLYEAVYSYEVSTSHDAVEPLSIDMFGEGDIFEDLGLTG